jgi:hypothetical protein
VSRAGQGRAGQGKVGQGAAPGGGRVWRGLTDVRWEGRACANRTCHGRHPAPSADLVRDQQRRETTGRGLEGWKGTSGRAGTRHCVGWCKVGGRRGGMGGKGGRLEYHVLVKCEGRILDEVPQRACRQRGQGIRTAERALSIESTPSAPTHQALHGWAIWRSAVLRLPASSYLCATIPRLRLGKRGMSPKGRNGKQTLHAALAAHAV